MCVKAEQKDTEQVENQTEQVHCMASSLKDCGVNKNEGTSSSHLVGENPCLPRLRVPTEWHSFLLLQIFWHKGIHFLCTNAKILHASRTK